MKFASLAAGALILTTSFANAGTISFNSAAELAQGSFGTPQSTLRFSNGEVTVEATGQRVDDGVLIAGRDDITAYTGRNGGLGVCTSGADANGSGGCAAGDDHQIDGDGVAEIAIIDFLDDVVTLNSVTFSLFAGTLPGPNNDGNDDFDFAIYADTFAQANGIAPTFLLEDIQAEGNGVVTYTFATEYTGSVFGFGANFSDDEFKLQALSYSVAAVPLPAAAWMLIAGIGGLGALKRRSMKKTA